MKHLFLPHIFLILLLVSPVVAKDGKPLVFSRDCLKGTNILKIPSILFRNVKLETELAKREFETTSQHRERLDVAFRKIRATVDDSLKMFNDYEFLLNDIPVDIGYYNADAGCFEHRRYKVIPIFFSDDAFLYGTESQAKKNNQKKVSAQFCTSSTMTPAVILYS